MSQPESNLSMSFFAVLWAPMNPAIRPTRFFPSCSFSGSGFVQWSCGRQKTVFFDKLCIAQHDEELWLGLGNGGTNRCHFTLGWISPSKGVTAFGVLLLLVLFCFLHLAEETGWHLWTGRFPGPFRWADGPLVQTLFQSSLASRKRTAAGGKHHGSLGSPWIHGWFRSQWKAVRKMIYKQWVNTS